MTKVFNRIIHLPQFSKNIKQLAKKYRTIEDDIGGNFVNSVLKLYHHENKNTAQIERCDEAGYEYPKIYVAKKFVCRSLKETDKIRVVWAYYDKSDTIVYIEIFFKGEQIIPNKKKYQDLFKTLEQIGECIT